VVADAINLLINPKHRDFARFHIESINEFAFDQRLLERRGV
jgi:hypothetical protein